MRSGEPVVGECGEAEGATSPTPAAHDSKLEHEQVKLLFDYTKFHIGIYTTLASLLVGVLALSKSGQEIPFVHWMLWAAVAAIAAAGFAGGVIASSLPHHQSLRTFWEATTGPYRLRPFKGETWTYIEHTAFWAGLGLILLSFFFASSTWAALYDFLLPWIKAAAAPF